MSSSLRPSAEAATALLTHAERAAAVHPACATQVAVARNGALLAFATFGRAGFAGGEEQAARVAAADDRTLFSIFSVTKALVSAAAWILLQERRLALEDRVVEHVPEFGTHGKEAVTVEHLLTHTAGFPGARLPDRDWPDRECRLQHLASWRLAWEPGSRFVYHPTATMWVVAELITRLGGFEDYRTFVRRRILEPLGLANLYLGLPAAENPRVADVVAVGEAPSAEARAVSPVDAPTLGDDVIAWANDPAVRAIGGPGGGAIATAADVALFYQALLADAAGRGPGIWDAAVLRDAWTIRNPALLDPMTGQPALRGLGVVLAGAEGKVWRGFSERCSSSAFGHMGAGGQISWADPATGLSFVFLTNGAHRDPVHQGATGIQLSTSACGSGC